ncbi:Nif3-like dinuclear metal center hexameric protein [Streptococcus pantholopis]|uniref:GTP cyclohydrolase 1 type 2 homolog n=1 Tax=Streptococcus pantholopis TaxID=1811193 RepID=A0A172Q835_9STRE|nr:Nif3-like dinuclear metal center hexameric protein [Streptococcus pantholopis]AND79587.1 Nif3-like dinuclear metal center hexameric protein [Streptococcus pantholopis]
MKASDITAFYEAYCPQELSLEGDISGWQIGRPDKEVKTLMLALDIREATVAEAIAKKVDLIIVKHAPIFKPLTDLTASPRNQIYLDLIRHDIAVYVSHTNIDVVPDGLNDWFCDALGIFDTDILTPTDKSYGIGRIGSVEPQTLAALASKVKKAFHLDAVRLIHYGSAEKRIQRVAICGGSGSGFYHDALAKGADVYITGDIYYHTAQEMLTNGLLAIDPGHHIEVLFVEKLTEKFQAWQHENSWDITVIGSQADTNPFSHI